MKNFRKIASVMLVLILAVALVGCSNAEKKSPAVGPVAPTEANAEVEAFVDEYGSIFADSFEEVKKLEYRYEEIKRGIDVYTAKMTALLESQLGILKKVETSDATFAEITGMREAVEEVEAVEREIEEQKITYSEPEEELVVDFDEEEEPVVEETEETKEVPDFDTQEIEYLLNADK